MAEAVSGDRVRVHYTGRLDTDEEFDSTLDRGPMEIVLGAGTVIAGFEEDIRVLCDEILDAALPLGTFDATKEIARQLPMRMLGRIIGTPDEDLPWLVELRVAARRNCIAAHCLGRCRMRLIR